MVVEEDLELEKNEMISGSHRTGSFKLNKSLRLSLIGSESRAPQHSENEEEKFMVKAASIMRSNRS